jgi:dTMP kinase
MELVVQPGCHVEKMAGKEQFAVPNTGLRRSPLTQPGWIKPKRPYLNRHDIEPFLCHDFADSLRIRSSRIASGFYVLSDRYFYSIIARDMVRGLDPSGHAPYMVLP